MYSGIFYNMGLDAEKILLIVMGVCVLLLILLIINLIKTIKLKKKYQQFMEGKDGKSLESIINDTYNKYDDVCKKVDNNSENIEHIIKNLKKTYQKMGIVKYDAFNEMGGKLSFSLALLDKDNNGFIINAMHSREGCYTYVKEIVKGESYIVLADEEREALNEALA